MARRAHRGARRGRKYATDWVCTQGFSPVNVATDPNGLAFDLTPTIVGVAGQPVTFPSITILRIVGTCCLYQPVASSGTGTIALASMGIRVVEVDGAGNIFDESLVDPAVIEDSWMFWRNQPFGSVKAPGTQTAHDEVNSGLPDGVHVDVKVNRRIKTDEQALVLQLEADSFQGYAALSDYRVMYFLRILWRVSAGSAPG